MAIKSIMCPSCGSKNTRANTSKNEQVCLKCGHKWKKGESK